MNLPLILGLPALALTLVLIVLDAGEDWQPLIQAAGAAGVVLCIVGLWLRTSAPKR